MFRGNREDLIDRGQLLLLLGGLLLGRLLGLLGLLLRSHGSTPLSFVRVRTTDVAPQNVINMNYFHFEMQLCRAFQKSPQIANFKKPAFYKG